MKCVGLPAHVIRPIQSAFLEHRGEQLRFTNARHRARVPDHCPILSSAESGVTMTRIEPRIVKSCPQNRRQTGRAPYSHYYSYKCQMIKPQ